VTSIRRRIALASLASSIGILAVVSVVVYIGVRFVLVRQFDRGLLEEARLISGMIEFKAGDIEVDIVRTTPEGALTGIDPFVEVWHEDGTILHRSKNLRSVDLTSASGTDTAPDFGWADVGSYRVRYICAEFMPAVDSDVELTEAGIAAVIASGKSLDVPRIRIAIGRYDDPITDVLSDLLILLGVSGALLSAGAFVVSLGIANEGLRPLREFASGIARIDDRSLSSRLDMARAPSEVMSVGQRLNELLDRVEAALERERAFSADIAHELRTPLAGIRSALDVALRRPREMALDREALEDVRGAASRLQTLVDRLMWLVRLDAGAVEVERQATELAPLVRETWLPLEADAAARELSVEWSVPEGLEVHSDPVLAGIILRNVLENAVAYTDEKGRIAVRAVPRGDQVAFEVSNTGSLLSQEQVPHLLRRFTRGDTARSVVGSRCGLGLPLVEKIAGVLGHPLDVRTQPGGEFTVGVTMPRA
jgi:two-component system OmpR family sensor kinase